MKRVISKSFYYRYTYNPKSLFRFLLSGSNRHSIHRIDHLDLFGYRSYY